MKVPKLGILLILIFVVTCKDRKKILAENIRKFAESRNKPAGSDELISYFDNKLSLLFYTLTLEELEEIKVKYDLSDILINQIKTIPYSRVSAAKKIEEKQSFTYYAQEETLGAAIKENDGKVSFALIRTRSYAVLKDRYEIYYIEKCNRVWVFFKKCRNEEHRNKKNLSNEEQFIVGNATKYSAINSILEGVDFLEKNDYELYMSETGTLFSPDHQSVAHITYFGNIAIGPTSELNSILPIESLQYDSNTIKVQDFPTTRIGTDFYTIKTGKLYKFNFLINNQFTSFSGEYYDKIHEDSKKGPYALEVKKNGNVIFYSKKNPNNILWQTDTANRGKGPYKLSLTNDKILILEDSNGEIIYRSPEYKETPSISYSVSGSSGEYIFNGLINTDNRYNSLNPTLLYIMTDNKKYTISYDIRHKGSLDINEFVSYTQPPFPARFFYKERKMDLFRAYYNSDHDNKEYDVCYTVRLNYGKWTSIGCNGDFVGFNTTDDYGQDVGTNYYEIKNLIIYFKRKEESIPDISALPKVVSPRRTEDGW